MLDALLLFDDRRGHRRARGIVLADEAVEVALPDVGHLGVARLFVVTGAAREEAALGCFVPGSVRYGMPSLSTSR